MTVPLPELRFPEFKKAWATKHWKSVAPLQRGFDLPVSEFIEGSFPVVYSNGILRKHIEPKVSGPGVVTGRSGTIGKVTFVEEDYWPHNTSLWVTNFCGNDPHWISELLRQQRLEYISTGSGVPTLNRNEIHRLKVSIPALQEQKKIAAFLSAVDSKLEAVEAQLAGWREYKRGMMQALFSQTLRFKADDGSEFPDWKETKLSKLAKFEKGRGISKSDISENGTAPCIRYGELYTTYGNVIEEVISMTDYPPKNPIMSSGNDVIIPSSGETAEDIATASAVLVKNVILGGDLNVIRTEENAHFLAALLSNKYRIELAKLAQGNSVVHLYSKDMKGLKIEMPSLPEQQKIADALSAIDVKIEALTQSLEAAREFKRGLLQKMFV